jgi:glutathione S-transferase
VTFSNQTEALMTKLYWAPRTRSLRALWVLEEAGVPYERVRLDLSAGEHKSADYCAINPMAKVPALTDGPVAIAESGAICAYVAEASRSGPCPAGWGSHARTLPAMAVFLAGLCRAGLFDQVLQCPGSTRIVGERERTSLH